ncbi:hypothetical protein TTHERM_000994171 (macronuclear) [Tetrahymena thermophila SB210]|uniref:Uncharacterized protein n=1 Tax=Tetrahymena thermophila (strain SB210) TaxID=312017 RepID=W7XGD3_TETTS|nr:hypothetical protein TTHERM_000994171 [Tetrahymena thermophila SB210]EWS71939.1 hypothetical protein TTHERM_000994171 [Tetrahymena thermophila SB210]|eukprot:XP_012655525.1 hypothetical protein TTHERM_000994171 [Tetrahymena thermophila SB210]
MLCQISTLREDNQRINYQIWSVMAVNKQRLKAMRVILKVQFNSLLLIQSLVIRKEIKKWILQKKMKTIVFKKQKNTQQINHQNHCYNNKKRVKLIKQIQVLNN